MRNFSIERICILCILLNCILTLSASIIELDGIEYDYFPGQLDGIRARGIKDPSKKTVRIPAIASNGMKVLCVTSGAFKDNNCIESVIIEDGISSIGDEAFMNCVNLKKVELPDYIQIQSRAFAGCISLNSIKIPAYDINNILSNYMLMDCSALTDVSFAPNAVLSKSMFMGCTSLRDIKLPPNIEKIPDGTFSDCINLKYINCDNLRSIGNNAFKGCISLDSVNLPESLESIGYRAFANSGLKGLILPKKITDLGTEISPKNIVDGCEKLTKIVVEGQLPHNVRADMFTSSSESIKSLTIESCKDIRGSFSGWKNLEKIELGTVSFIDTQAFNANTNLYEIKIHKCSTLNRLSKSIKTVTIDECVTIADECFRECKLLENFSINSVKNIGNRAFQDCHSLKNIVLPPDVESIGGYSFYGCKSLESVELKNSCDIGIYTFANCTELKNVQLNKSISRIGGNSFTNCINLETLHLPTKLTTIENEMFKDCLSLREIELHEGLLTLGNKCFSESNLSKIVVPKSVTNISDAFINCKNLTSIVVKGNLDQYIKLPIAGNEEEVYLGGCDGFSADNISSIKSISIENIRNNVSICYCENLDSLYLNNVESFRYCNHNPILRVVHLPKTEIIQRDCFIDCKKLEHIYANNIKEIETRAFSGCSSLKEFDFSKIEKIGGSAFSDCQSLVNVEIYNENAEIGSNVFNNCISLENVLINGYIPYADSGFFAYCNNLKNVSFGNCEILGSYLFNGKTELSKFSTQKTRTIERCVFQDCINLKEISLGEDLQKIERNAFTNCGLETISLPESLESIGFDDGSGGYVFSDCHSLRNIVFPKNLTYIPRYTFLNCENLEEVILPEKLTYIGNDAFKGNNNLQSIISLNETPPNIAGYLGCNYGSVNLYVKEDCIEFYRNSSWKSFFNPKNLKSAPYKSLTRDWKGFDSVLEAKGCTADGKSQLLMWFETPIDTKTCNVKYYNEDNFRNYTLFKEENNVNLWRYKDLNNPEYFTERINSMGFVYTAPDDYTDALSSYNIKIEVTEEPIYMEEYKCKLVPAASYSKVIEIWRPAAMLVHGLFSDSTAMVPLRDYLQSMGRYKNYNHVFCADYQATNSASFYDNTYKYKVIEENMKKLHDALYEKGHIVSSSYDLVGHSMGGILSRLYAGLGKKEASRINRLITINTPHSGSQWADWIEDITKNLNLVTFHYKLEAAFLAAKAFWIANFPMAVSNLSVSNATNNFVNCGNNLCKGIPIHSVTTYLNTLPNLPEEVELLLDIKDLITETNKLGFLKDSFKDAINNNVRIPTSPYQISLLLSSEAGKPELNDMVVPFTSQTGGLINPCAKVLNSEWHIDDKDTPFVPASHTISCKWYDVRRHVADCLEASKYSDIYSTDGFKPKKLHYAWRDEIPARTTSEIEPLSYTESVIAKASKSSSLKLSNIVVEGIDLRFDVIQGNDVKSNSVIGTAKNGYAFWDNSKSSYSFELPRVFDEDVELLVFGKNSSNELVIDSINVNIKTENYPDKISFINKQDTIYLEQGATMALRTMASWKDGYEEKVSPIISSDNDCIIINDYDLIGYRPGVTLIKAEYAGCVDSCYVKVLLNDDYTEFEPVVMPTKILIDKEYLLLTVDDSYDIAVDFLPENAGPISIVWKSSDESVAEVDTTGKITAKSVGECQISGYTLTGLECACTVKVVDNVITATNISIQPESVALQIGESAQLSCVFTPDEASDKRVEWTTDNPDIVTVDQNGYVTRVANGFCRIGAKTMDGSNIETFCIMQDNDTSISDIPEDTYIDVYDIAGHTIIKNGYSDQIKALQPGIYIIVIDGKPYKYTKVL